MGTLSNQAIAGTRPAMTNAETALHALVTKAVSWETVMPDGVTVLVIDGHHGDEAASAIAREACALRGLSDPVVGHIDRTQEPCCHDSVERAPTTRVVIE